MVIPETTIMKPIPKKFWIIPLVIIFIGAWVWIGYREVYPPKVVKAYDTTCLVAAFLPNSSKQWVPGVECADGIFYVGSDATTSNGVFVYKDSVTK